MRSSTNVLCALTVLVPALSSAASDEARLPAHRYTAYPEMSVAPAAPGVPDAARQRGRNWLIIGKSGPQHETTIAVDPTDPRHLLASSNDLSNFSTFTNVRESFDGGRTWVNAGLIVNAFCYDPWLAFNTSGDAFFAYECGDQRVAYRRAGDPDWVQTLLMDSERGPDRDMITVDNDPTSPGFNRVYIGYDEASANHAAHVLYSPDGFGNWKRSPKINDSSEATGVNVATCSETVHAVWEDFNGRKLLADRSANGGATWGTDRVVTNFRLNTETFFISIPPQPNRGITANPFSDCAPAGAAFAGRLYVAYVDKSPAASSADTDVYVRFSDDRGETWSAEVEVSDETVNAYQFHQAISVGPDGMVAVSFYDTRDDPTNKKTHRYISFSTDGGETWTANERLTDKQSDESGPESPDDYGDYQGIDARPDQGFWNVWTDSRPGTRAEDVAGALARPTP